MTYNTTYNITLCSQQLSGGMPKSTHLRGRQMLRFESQLCH